ncbi:Lipase [Grifola frondosa]|uniref:Lipase n=1 Tax=Grifola frondosa TaxID=5627 RepID=A0A1C7M4M1_GRIFR|nr:Lipase [Grifola frondosa]
MHFLSTVLLCTVLSSAAGVFAAPARISVPVQRDQSEIERRDGVTTLSLSQFAAFTPFTQFARAAYCASSKITNWQCGQACDALPGFQPTLTGGDGNAVQLFFVGYWPADNAVVVAHQGTDPTALLSDLTDIEIPLKNLDATLFPGVSSSVEVHEGFANEHAQTASTILTETKRLIQVNGATTVMLVGHSLGGALAELDALFMTLNLPSSIHVKAVTYGTPRVGNPAFASLFDSEVPDFVRINNESDLIPIVPGRFLGFQHPHGETHIVSEGDVVSCPGDDDATDSQCTIQTVPNVFDGDILDHLGPYGGIFIGTIFCT